MIGTPITISMWVGFLIGLYAAERRIEWSVIVGFILAEITRQVLGMR